MSAWPTRVVLAVLACSAMAAAGAQLAPGGGPVHERLEVTIRADGSAHVLHELKGVDSPVTLLSVPGEHSGVRISDAAGNEAGLSVTEHDGGFGVDVPASPPGTTVEYDLAAAVTRKGDYHVWSYSYPAETLFFLPPDTGRIYVNGGAVDIGNGRFLCHGCYALLEYPHEERIYSYALAGGAPEARMEIRTAATISGAVLDPGVGVISAEIVGGERAYVDVAVPRALLDGPYEAYLDGKRIAASAGQENATHAWLQARAGGGTLNVFGEGGEPAAGGGGTPAWAVGAAVAIAGAGGVAATLAAWARRRRGAR